jgi:hypothetical protein
MAMKNLNSNSWASLARELLYQYNIPSAFQLVENPPQKQHWKKIIKNAIGVYWQEDSINIRSLSMVNLQDCQYGKVHLAWKCGDDPLQVVLASTKVKLMVQRYPLSSTHCAVKHQSKHCPICNGPPESMTHFILECPQLEKTRKPHNYDESQCHL